MEYGVEAKRAVEAKVVTPAVEKVIRERCRRNDRSRPARAGAEELRVLTPANAQCSMLNVQWAEPHERSFQR
jgi:hypothetical protein